MQLWNRMLDANLRYGLAGDASEALDNVLTQANLKPAGRHDSGSAQHQALCPTRIFRFSHSLHVRSTFNLRLFARLLRKLD
jgi:hypothetical protein